MHGSTERGLAGFIASMSTIVLLEEITNMPSLCFSSLTFEFSFWSIKTLPINHDVTNKVKESGNHMKKIWAVTIRNIHAYSNFSHPDEAHTISSSYLI